MRKIIYSLLAMVCFGPVIAQQNLHELLQEIEANNTGYKAQQSLVEAQQLENRVGNVPANPQLEGGYLWGSPSAVGNRKDFSVTQEIDFPTVYHHQRKLADLRDRQAEMTADQYRLELRIEAAQLWVELVCLNRKIDIGKERTTLAKKLADAYEQRLAVGDANRIDRNKAALNALQSEKHLHRLEQERELLLLNLFALNGNQPVAVETREFAPVELAPDFEHRLAELLQQSPRSKWYALQSEASDREVKLYQSKKLPRISGGYMLENTVGEKFQGVTLGLSIPLWENKNTVKAARLRQQAGALEQEDFQLHYKAEMTRLARSVQLNAARVEELRRELAKIEQQELLKEALDAGHLSLIDYLLEMQFNYEVEDQLLESERDLQLAWTQLKVLEN
ncbi:TolC family protein [Mangrovibacterium sp.]|uniref:TolC family protein n=1 Tax=Mangrovibacterium sp. TaxID=1961364 RepID=UPI003568CAD1